MNVIGNFQIDWGVLKYMFRAASFLDFDVVWPSFPNFHTPCGLIGPAHARTAHST